MYQLQFWINWIDPLQNLGVCIENFDWNLHQQSPCPTAPIGQWTSRNVKNIKTMTHITETHARNFLHRAHHENTYYTDNTNEIRLKNCSSSLLTCCSHFARAAEERILTWLRCLAICSLETLCNMLRFSFSYSLKIFVTIILHIHNREY